MSEHRLRIDDAATLSPYLIPKALAGHKVRNLGDGFILRAIERNLGVRFDAKQVYSPRVEPDEEAKTVMRQASSVILAGANQLNDKYSVWPGLDADHIRSAGYRFVPFGIGVHGEDGFCDGMSQNTKAVLEAVHESIAFSSWRCPLTIEYLQRNLPHLSSQFLMTGCPVVYDRPLLESERFAAGEAAIAVTPTERGDFWERETAIIDAVAKRFPKARRYLVAHQDFSPAPWHENMRHRFLRQPHPKMTDRIEALRAYARHRGYEPVTPADADACMRFYENVDVHVGTRLHAHLLFLSRNKRSFLVPVDDRSRGMAAFLGFPLPSASSLQKHWDADFEVIRKNARSAYPTLTRFVESLNP